MQLIKVKALKNTYFQFGLVQAPWLDFEQSINNYRVQGKMFVERNLLIGSADFGILYAGLLGGEMDEEYKKNVNNKNTGKYGSFAVGIYNGPGYNAIEYNSDKVLEGRLTLRPLPNKLPGMQLTYSFAYGKNNTVENPSLFKMNIFYFSSESKQHKFAAQYYKGKGDAENIYYSSQAEPFKNKGFSFFGEYNILKTKWAIFGRYDQFFTQKTDNSKNEVYIGGIAYKFLKNKVVFDFEQSEYQEAVKRIYEIALEINF